jgi:hypothetical protein
MDNTMDLSKMTKRQRYYYRHKEELQAENREYYQNNKERLIEKAKAYYQANKERIKARQASGK